MTDELRMLYESLQGRHRPEDILREVSQVTGVAQPQQKRYWWGWSGMNVEFDAPKPPIRSARKLVELVGLPRLADADFSDPAVLRGFGELLQNGLLLLANGKPLNRRDRRNWEVKVSRRQYNRIYRLTRHLLRETADLERQLILYQLGRVAKTNYATTLTWEEFSKDAPSAAFVAYMAANLGRRSLFIAAPQARAFDEVAEAIYGKLAKRPETNWFAVAHVFPRNEVLDRVEPEKRALLLGRALETMRLSGQILRDAVTPDVDVNQMIVSREADSSSWNAAAGSWNKGRDYWLALMDSLGRHDAIDRFCPGKVMRLMAADVVRWHGKLHPDTHVWALLPKPWEVLFDGVDCNRAQVVAACRRENIDPWASGWAGPRPRTAVEEWRPTPESVHGVTVADPVLGVWLRKMGIFSGQSLRPEQITAFTEKFGEHASFVIRRQIEGDGAYAVGAEWAESSEKASPSAR